MMVEGSFCGIPNVGKTVYTPNNTQTVYQKPWTIQNPISHVLLLPYIIQVAPLLQHCFCSTAGVSATRPFTPPPTPLRLVINETFNETCLKFNTDSETNTTTGSRRDKDTRPFGWLLF